MEGGRVVSERYYKLARRTMEVDERKDEAKKGGRDIGNGNIGCRIERKGSERGGKDQAVNKRELTGRMKEREKRKKAGPTWCKKKRRRMIGKNQRTLKEWLGRAKNVEGR